MNTGALVRGLVLGASPTRFAWSAFRLEIVFKDEAHTTGQGPLTMVSTTYRRR